MNLSRGERFISGLNRYMAAKYEKAKPGKLIQDWTPYNESVIWDIANHYYKNKGIATFSNDNNRSVPHDINTNFQNALSIAKLVKAVVDTQPLIEKFQVLECGAGSGLFSRQFLFALKELGIDKRVKLLVSDYSVSNISDIKSFGILNEFIEGENYELLEYNVLSSDSAKKLDGSEFQFKHLISGIFNYVLDALPVTILRKHFNPKKADFEELYLKVKNDNGVSYDIINNQDLMSNLAKEQKWVNFEIEKQTEAEQKFYEIFKNFHCEAARDAFIPYPYGPIQACENILKNLDDCGFIFSGDIPPRKTYFCQIVGNALAHEVDNEMICTYLQEEGYVPKFQDDNTISRMIVAKKEATLTVLDPIFQDVFVENNMVNRYADLRDALIKFEHKESADVMKYVLEEFEKIAGSSVYVGIFRGNYYGSIGNKEKAAEAYREAAKIDFTNNYKLNELAQRVSKKA